MYFRYYICFVSIFLFFACQQTVENQNTETSTKQSTTSKISIPNNSTSKTNLLIFKKENKGEIWENGVFQKELSIDDTENLPIGIFEIKEINEDNLLQFKFPDTFYKSKKWDTSNSRSSINLNEINAAHSINGLVLIFPNDNRDGESIPCFACPHWLAELYSSMELHALNYSKVKKAIN